jgi:hypothetical protein
VTVRNFVLTPSVLDPFRRQAVFNNHPFFSFLEHVVVDLTGSADEVTLRVLPALFAAVGVGLVVWAVARRRSLRAAAAAGVVLACNPTFLTTAREVRGYSLLVLCAVASSLLVFSSRRSAAWAYTAFAAVGLATHLYMAAVLAGHAAILWRREPLRPWWPRWATALLVGLVANMPLLTGRAVADRGRLFRPGFPAQLVVALGGGTWIALALLAPVLVLGWRAADPVLRRRGAAFVAGVVGVLWMVAPTDLYPRFFVWLVPAAAWVVAAGVERTPRLGPLLVAASVAASLASLPPLMADELANRQAAALVEPLRAEGRHVCGLGWSAEAFGPYLDVVPTGRLAGCDVAVVLVPSAHPQLVEQADRYFCVRRRLDALVPGILYTEPGPCRGRPGAPSPAPAGPSAPAPAPRRRRPGEREGGG